MNKEKTLQLLDKSLKSSTADQTELVLIAEDLSLSRFAENTIHQNITQSDHNLIARVVLGKKLGIASTNRLEEKEIKKCINDATEIAKFQKGDENFLSLPKSTQAKKVNAFYKQTSNIAPKEKAVGIQKIVKNCQKENLFSAGAFRNKKEALVVVNSLGTKTFFEHTTAHLSLTVNDREQNSGWAQDYNRDIDKLNIENVARIAIQKTLFSKNPTQLPPGKYIVILEEAAVASLLLFLSFLGFGAKTFIERRSFMSGKIGEKITGDNITIVEDPYCPENLGIPFDYEGTNKKKVILIQNGVARGVVYDSYYANIAGVESTGHALPPINRFGPYPKNLVMDAGDRTKEELIASTEKGILITHFWYINYMNPMRTMVTGTTRDGTFLIENGKVKSAVKNMRIGQSILEALSNAKMMTKRRKLCPQYGVSMLVPTMKIENFNFIPS